jgi:predicted component of type VI protein secretion system
MATGKSRGVKAHVHDSGLVSNTTAILRGHCLVFADATNSELVARCTVTNSPKFAGMARTGGDTTTADNHKDQAIGIDAGGWCFALNTSGAAIPEDSALTTHAAGGIKARAATELNEIGKTYVRIEDGEGAVVWINPLTLGA